MLTPTSPVTIANYNSAILSDKSTHVRVVFPVQNVTFTDSDISAEGGITLTQIMNPDVDMVMGKAVASQIVIHFINNGQFTGFNWTEEFRVDFGVEISGSTSWVTVGYFTGKKPERITRAEVIEFTALDRMSKFDTLADDFLSTLVYPKSMSQIYSALCTYIGVSSVTGNENSTVMNVSYSESPFMNGITCRALLAYIAEANCCYAKITSGGKVKLVWFADQTSNYSIDGDDYFSINLDEASVPVIDSVRISDTQNENNGFIYPVGTNDVVYQIVDNPLLLAMTTSQKQTVITNITTRFTTIGAYTPVAVNAIGNWLIETGDIIEVGYDNSQTVNMPVFSRTMQWNGGCSDVYELTGKTERTGKFVKIISGGVFEVDSTNFKISNADKEMVSGFWKFNDDGMYYKNTADNTGFEIADYDDKTSGTSGLYFDENIDSGYTQGKIILRCLNKYGGTNTDGHFVFLTQYMNNQYTKFFLPETVGISDNIFSCIGSSNNPFDEIDVKSIYADKIVPKHGSNYSIGLSTLPWSNAYVEALDISDNISIANQGIVYFKGGTNFYKIENTNDGLTLFSHPSGQSTYVLNGQLLTTGDIIDNLTSTSTTDCLSANQGKALNDNKVSKTGDTMTGSLSIQRASGGGVFEVKNTTSTLSTSMGISTVNDKDHGVYSNGYVDSDGTFHASGKWLLHRNANNVVYLDGNPVDRMLLDRNASSSCSDCNAVTLPGTYRIISSTANRPEDYATMLDMKSNDYVGQIAVGISSNSFYWRKNRTASWIKAAVDGQVVKKSGDTMSGALTVNANITGNKGLYAGTATSSTADSSLYANAALEVREAGRVGNTESTATFAPRIGFRWTGRAGASLAMHSNGYFYFKKQNGTDNARVYTGDVYSDNYNLEDVGNHKVTMKEYSVTTTANSYVSPFGAFAEYTIPSADITSYGNPANVTVMTDTSTNPAVASFNPTKTRVFVYSKSAASVKLSFIYIKTKD